MNIILAIVITIIIWIVMNRFINDKDEDFDYIIMSLDEMVCDFLQKIKNKTTWKKH